MKYFLTVVFTVLWRFAFPQTGVITGVVNDKASESPLVGATVQLLSNGNFIVITDKTGSFKLQNVPLGRQAIQISFTGYESNTIPNIDVITGKENVINISLVEAYSKLSDIIIKAGTNTGLLPNNKAAAVSARQFTLEEVTRYAGGRSDVARLATNFAGVSAPDDSRNDIVVRGNSPTGLLWRIEGIPVPSPNHFSSLGTTGSPVSALNPNVLTNSDFITSAFPSEYGNALGGVFDLGFKKGNAKKNEYQLSVGAFPGAEALAEGPMGKQGGSFVVAARYAVVGLISGAGGTTAPPNYSDLSFNLRFGKTRIGSFSIFGIGGNAKIDLIGEKAKETDLFAFKDEDGYVKSGFGVLGLKHNIFTSDNAYVRTTIGISSSFNTIDNFRYFNFKTPQQIRLTNFNVDNRTTRQTLSSFYNVKLNSKVNIRTGFLLENYMLKAKLSTRELQPDLNGDSYPDYNSILSNDGSFVMFQPFAQGQFRLTKILTLNAGLHGQQFSLNNQFVVEPRASMSLAVNSMSSFSIGYGLHHQNISEPLLFLNENIAGTLVQSNRNLNFVQSSHYVIAYDARLGEKWRLKIEAYHQSISKAAVEKISSGYSSLTEGSEFIFSTDKSSLVSKGTGLNRGIELTIEKFYSKGFHLLVTSSVFESKYKGSDGIERSTPYNNNNVLNFLGGKEFKIGQAMKNIFSIDTKITTAGGKHYTPIDLALSKAAGFQVTQTGQEFSQQYKNYFRMDLKFAVKFNSAIKRKSHQFYIDLQNITDNNNPFRFQYNRLTQKIDQLDQIGFFPDFGYKFQF